MTLKIYNLLSNKKEVFIPINNNVVTMYNCSSTIYDHIHIDNIRGFLVADIIRDYFQWCGYEVELVQSFSDINNKIIEKSNFLNETVNSIAKEYVDEYLLDISKLRIRKANITPRTTEYIGYMIDFIKELENNNFTYKKNGNIYFCIKKFKDCNKLLNENKDFILWEVLSTEEPSWNSPWGLGRPSHYIERNIIINKLFNKKIDINIGESNLTLFSCCGNKNNIQNGLANYWICNNSNKLSDKFFNIKDLLKEYSPQAVRYFLLSILYRCSLNYNRTNLDEAERSIEYINDGIDTGKKILLLGGDPDYGPFHMDYNEKYLDRFSEIMDDDFNTPLALSLLYKIIKEIHFVIKEGFIRKDMIALVNTAELFRNFFRLDREEEIV